MCVGVRTYFLILTFDVLLSQISRKIAKPILEITYVRVRGDFTLIIHNISIHSIACSKFHHHFNASVCLLSDEFTVYRLVCAVAKLENQVDWPILRSHSSCVMSEIIVDGGAL